MHNADERSQLAKKNAAVSNMKKSSLLRHWRTPLAAMAAGAATAAAGAQVPEAFIGAPPEGHAATLNESYVPPAILRERTARRAAAAADVAENAAETDDAADVDALNAASLAALGDESLAEAAEAAAPAPETSARDRAARLARVSRPTPAAGYSGDDYDSGAFNMASSGAPASFMGAPMRFDPLAGVDEDAAGPRPVFSTTVSPVRRPYVEAIERQLEGAFLTDEFVGLAVAVIEGPEITFLRTYGVTDTSSNNPVTPDTVFRFASVSKGFASTMVGQLVEEGRLSWNDRVADYVPDFRLRTSDATQRVTLENLLSHRVGLAHHAYDNFLERGESVGALLRRTASAPLDCNPGECHRYQNITYSLSGDIVARARGTTFEGAVQENIFDPLSMNTASVGLTGLRDSDSWAHPHRQRTRNGPQIPFEPNDNYYRVAAAGGLNGSILDLTHWVRAQLGYHPDVVSPELRERLWQPVVSTPRQTRRLGWMSMRLRDTNYGLGWRVFDYQGERLIFHAGGVAGYRALVGILPERDMGFAVLWNSRTGRGWRIMPTILDAYLGYEDEDWLGVSDILSDLEPPPPSRILSGEP